jgi:hypothetical protein
MAITQYVLDFNNDMLNRNQKRKLKLRSRLCTKALTYLYAKNDLMRQTAFHELERNKLRYKEQKIILIKLM